ncbi:hypothetical protein EXIGLDRAFT_820278, partial [Exidia glandulosa HHB12029]
MLIAGANAAYNGCVAHGLSGLTQNTVLNEFVLSSVCRTARLPVNVARLVGFGTSVVEMYLGVPVSSMYRSKLVDRHPTLS